MWGGGALLVFSLCGNLEEVKECLSSRLDELAAKSEGKQAKIKSHFM